MYIAFVDFTKAFDSVNRDLLLKILTKLGCPPKFVRVIKKLYSDVHAGLIVDGVLTEPFVYNSGEAMVQVSADSLWDLCCYSAFTCLQNHRTPIQHQNSVSIRRQSFRSEKTKGKTESSHGLHQRSAICRRYCHLQRLFSRLADDVDCIQDLSKKMGLSINIKKTETTCIGLLR